jgi:hypothetical protein
MFRSSFLTALVFAFLLLLALSGCSQPNETLGSAYVAPATLNVRHDLGQKSGTVVTLKHGDRVGIVDVQRRFVKIRTGSGAEGWVDSLELLSAVQMDQLRKVRQEQSSLPAEGFATAFEALNVHIEPNRASPAFAQIAEGGSVTILGHQIAPKVSASARSSSLVIERSRPPARRQRREQQSRLSFRLPPRPLPPKPPANWQELSAERIDSAESSSTVKTEKDKEAAAEAAKKAQELKRPIVMEDWTLVRTKANEIGWVLTRNLMMSIPDEVAQYAEGKHITSFFDLGAVNDEVKGIKHDWLWTTSSGLEPYDFDSWRVFLWNPRRHRYETSYRQRDLEGYFPVQVERPDSDRPLRTFQIVTKDDDGKFRRRTYRFDGTLVHLIGTEDYRPGAGSNEQKVDAQRAEAIDTGRLHSRITRPSWFGRQWSALKRRLFGGT